MPQITEIDKARRHIAKKFSVTIKGLHPSPLIGRIKGPKVLLNSIPKAGTHLLELALDKYPLLRNAGEKTVTAPNRISEATIKKIRAIKKGQFLNAHLQAHAVILDLLRNSDVKVLFMIRDPRDVAVSRFKYAMDIDQTHKAYKYFRSLTNDHDRLMASLTGAQNIILPVGKVFARFADWIDEKYVLICRFEDLIGEQGGGSSAKQLQALAAIAKHLKIELGGEKLRELASKVYSSQSSTFHKGRLGAWRQYFKEEHKRCFMETSGKLLFRYGYELEDDW